MEGGEGQRGGVEDRDGASKEVGVSGNSFDGAQPIGQADANASGKGQSSLVESAGSSDVEQLQDQLVASYAA